jgi:ubiquinone/menaquinone biosynthesis C-methylase UbiE
MKYKEMVRDYQRRGEPLGWFDSIYSDAEGDHKAVFWADLSVNPYLEEWLKLNPIGKNKTKKAIAIGCGVGDDAEAMAKHGYTVTAFDIAPTAIALCKKRYIDSNVEYIVADLFNYSTQWVESYDLVYECNTIQVLPGKYRRLAMEAMVKLLSKRATLLVSCRSREKGKQENDIPLPLDKDEIDIFCKLGLLEKFFLAYNDTQEPAIPHFFATFLNYKLEG